VIRGNTFEIVGDKFERTLMEYKLMGFGDEEAYDCTAKSLIESFAMNALAIENGCEVADDEVWREVGELKESLKSSEGRAELKKYLRATGLTEEEYWNEQFESLKRHGNIHLYRSVLREEFIMENGLEDKPLGAVETKFSEYYCGLVNDTVKSENIQF